MRHRFSLGVVYDLLHRTAQHDIEYVQSKAYVIITNPPLEYIKCSSALLRASVVMVASVFKDQGQCAAAVLL